MSFDITSYEMGKKKGGTTIEIKGDSEYTFEDKNNDGNIVIKKKEAVNG